MEGAGETFAGFTARQADAWPRAIDRIRRHAGGVADDPASYYWTLTWHDESRPGRGSFLDAIWTDGEHLAQITMDVYGYPVVSVAAVEWLHSDGDEACACDFCQDERRAEDEATGPTV